MPSTSPKQLADDFEDALRHLETTSKLVRLVAQLESHIENSPPEEYVGNVDRARIIALQVSVGRFFGSLGCKAIAREFFRIAGAFHDLDSGTVDEILKPKSNPKGGRTPDPHHLWIARAGVSAALECFLIAEDQEALGRIAKRKNELAAVLRTGTKNIESAAANWLKQFRDRILSSPAGDAWQPYAAMIEKFKRAEATAAEWIELGNMFLNVACTQAANSQMAPSRRKKSNPSS